MEQPILSLEIVAKLEQLERRQVIMNIQCENTAMFGIPKLNSDDG